MADVFCQQCISTICLSERSLYIDHHPQEMHQSEGGDRARIDVVFVSPRLVQSLSGIDFGGGLGHYVGDCLA